MTHKIDNLLLSVGAAKSGTTWLFSQLELHPRIFGTPIKEVHYFAHHHSALKMLASENRVATVAGLAGDIRHRNGKYESDLTEWCSRYLSDPVDDDWFRALFYGAGKNDYCAEFSNLNAMLPVSGWQHVFEMARNVRLLYILREPLSRYWSHACYHLALIGQAELIEQWNRESWETFIPLLGPHGDYTDAIVRMRSFAGQDRLIVLDYGDVARDSLKLLRRVEAFLGLDTYDYPEDALRKVVHSSDPRGEPTQAFLDAVRPMVSAEMETLRALNLDPAPEWLR